MPGALQPSMRTGAVCVGLFLAAMCGGCSFGPRVLEQSYGPYYESLRHVDEEELLRNLVHLRYNEGPGSLSVSSIAAQYELSGQAEARPFFVAPNPSSHPFETFTSILPDASAMGANRPTISFVPGDDSEAIRRFHTPITLDNLVFLVQTGWSLSAILRMWSERLNGVPNPVSTNQQTCESSADPRRFERALEVLQSVAGRELLSTRVREHETEVSGPLPSESVTAAASVEAVKANLELRRRADGKTWVLVRRERQLVAEVTSGAEHDPELIELETLLNLLPGQSRYGLVVAPGLFPDPLLHPTPPSAELRITPRSTAQVYLFLSHGVQAPSEHVAAGLVVADLAPDCASNCQAMTGGLFAVHTSAGIKPPSHAYAAVKYRGWWYYIDDNDAQSKMTFAHILQLSRLDLRRRPPGGGPLLTLPAGR